MIWHDRGLYISPIKYALCLHEKRFKYELKRLKITEDVPYTLNNADSTVHYFRHTENNDECCIVCLRMDRNIELLQVYGLLVHEAVHIWQTITDIIGEKNESEFEAYCIQRIAQNLFYSYEKLTKKKKKK
jgi:hypothetical protein